MITHVPPPPADAPAEVAQVGLPTATARPAGFARAADTHQRLARIAFEQLRRGRLDRFAAAVRAGADPNGREAAPDGLLPYVVFQQRRGGLPGVPADEAIGLLLSLGCDPNGTGTAPGLPLYLAAQMGRWDIFGQLLDAGADPDAQPPQVRCTIAALVMRAPDPMPLLTALAACGADFNTGAGTASLTGPEAALDPVHVPALRLMLDHGADAGLFNSTGESLMHLAVGSPPALRLLAEHGADVNAQDPSGFTPLMMACRMPVPIESLDALIESGADVTLRTDGGQTALHVNAWGLADPQRVHRLARAGADLDARDRQGLTAAAVAAVGHRTEVYDALAQAGANLVDVTDPMRVLAHVRRFVAPYPGEISIDPRGRFASFAIERLDATLLDDALCAQFVRVLEQAGLHTETGLLDQRRQAQPPQPTDAPTRP